MLASEMYGMRWAASMTATQIYNLQQSTMSTQIESPSQRFGVCSDGDPGKVSIGDSELVPSART